MFTYSDLQDYCRKSRISVQEIAKECNLTDTGIKRGLNKQSLAFRYVLLICNSVGITPNQFFGVDSTNGIHQTQNGGVGNTQIVDQGIAALKEQLRVKDDQINKLLNIISK